MRRLGIALAIVLGVVLVAVVLVVLNLDRLLDANRDRIVAGMSAGFARPVEVARITAAFHGGPAVQLEGLRIADDPAYSTDDFLRAARTYAVVHFWPLLRGRIEVRRIAVRAPEVTLIRDAHGMNVDSLGRRTAQPAPGGPATPSGSSAPGAIPAFAIALVSLEDGVVRWVDRSGPTPTETTVAPLHVRLSDVSLTTPLQMEVDATTAEKPPTKIHVRGTVGPVGDPPFGADVPVEQHVAIESGTVEVRDLTIRGRVRRSANGAPIASVQVAAPSIRAAGMELTALDVAVTESAGVAVLERLAFSIFGGTIEGKGRVDHTGTSPGFAVETHVRSVDVSQALALRAPEMAARFEGRLDADCAVSGSAGDEAVVRRSLAGDGHGVIRNGRLRGVNVADGVLSGVTGLPGIATLVPPRVRDRYPAVFATKDTVFDELASDFRLAGERIHFDRMTAAAHDYAVRAKGVVTFDRHADLSATLELAPQLTADIVGAIKEVKLLTDDEGRLAIPFRLVGVLPDVRPRPDADFVSRLLRKALTAEGLERLLGGGKHGTGDGRGRNAIQRGLDKLFGR